MKSLPKKLFCFFLIALLTVSMIGCGSSEPDPNAGLYIGKTGELGGLAVDLADVFDSEFSIELMNGGKEKFNYDGDSYNIKWTLDGTSFHAEGRGAELDGTLSDGVMVLENVLDSGLNITLER